MGALTPYEGRTVTLVVGFKYVKVVTGTLRLTGSGRSVTVVADRLVYVPLGEVRELVDVETGRRVRL